MYMLCYLLGWVPARNNVGREGRREGGRERGREGEREGGRGRGGRRDGRKNEAGVREEGENECEGCIISVTLWLRKN